MTTEKKPYIRRIDFTDIPNISNPIEGYTQTTPAEIATTKTREK